MVDGTSGHSGPADGARVTQAQGPIADRLVADRLLAALTPDYRPFQNVAWLGRTLPLAAADVPDPRPS
jgi:hypothetical protein